VLGYMEEFLTNPDEAARKLFLKEELGWNIRPSDLRNHMRELLFELQAEQQTRHLKQREEKKLLKAKRKAMAESSSQISSPPKPVASPSPAPKLPGSFPSDSPERKPKSDAEPSSTESVQEADNLKDSKLNGGILHEDEQLNEQRFKALSEPQFISCLSDASGASPTITKSKIPPTASSKAAEEPQFIGCVSKEQSIGSNVPKGKIALTDSSLASKRNGYVSKLVVELKTVSGRDRSQFEESILTTDDEDDVQFVKQQQSSASSESNEATPKPTETSRSRQSSVELIGETKSRPSSSHMHDQRTKTFTSSLPRLKARKNLESDNTRRGPRYEGIDRSAAIS
jgi:sentrin-specific protease 7